MKLLTRLSNLSTPATFASEYPAVAALLLSGLGLGRASSFRKALRVKKKKLMALSACRNNHSFFFRLFLITQLERKLLSLGCERIGREFITNWLRGRITGAVGIPSQGPCRIQEPEKIRSTNIQFQLCCNRGWRKADFLLNARAFIQCLLLGIALAYFRESDSLIRALILL